MVFEKHHVAVNIETHRRQSEFWCKDKPNRVTKFEAHRLPKELKDHILKVAWDERKIIQMRVMYCQALRFKYFGRLSDKFDGKRRTRGENDEL